MNTEERIAKLKEIWPDQRWAEDAVDILNESLSEDEFKARCVESVELGSSRWYEHMLEVIEVDKDVFVGVCWDSGLTENQENMYDVDDDVYLLDKQEVVTIEWKQTKRL